MSIPAKRTDHQPAFRTYIVWSGRLTCDSGASPDVSINNPPCMAHLREDSRHGVVGPLTPHKRTYPINRRSGCYHLFPGKLVGGCTFTIQDPSFGQNLGTSAYTEYVLQLGIRPFNVIYNRRVVVCISTPGTARNHCTQRQFQRELSRWFDIALSTSNSGSSSIA